MNEKRPGICTNGGCPRLATVEATIPTLGRKALCYHCHQALQPMFGDMRPVIFPRQPAPTLGGAA